jgi:hypothetical protein
MMWMLIVAVGSLLWPAPTARITKVSFDRIKPGMSLHKVEGILGGKPGDYRTGPTCSCLSGFFSESFEADDNVRSLQWRGTEADIKVWVDVTGKVRYTGYTLRRLKPVGPSEWLLWRWNRWWRYLRFLVPKLCLGTPSAKLRFAPPSLTSECPGETEFREDGSQTEFGNQGSVSEGSSLTLQARTTYTPQTPSPAQRRQLSA